jgi:hypothetical protein
MRLPQEGWGITALFSRFDMDRFNEAGILAQSSQPVTVP